METTTDCCFRVLRFDGAVEKCQYCDTAEEGLTSIVETGSGRLQRFVRSSPEDTIGDWKMTFNERDQLEEYILYYSVAFKSSQREISELIAEVNGVPIDTDGDDPAALRLLTDEQLKAVAAKCLSEDLMAINEASAQAAELQGAYWDSLRGLEMLIGFDIDSTDELSDVTFSSIAEAKEYYSIYKEKCVD